MNANHDVERLVYKQAVGQYSSVLRTMQQIIFLSLEKRLATFDWNKPDDESPIPFRQPMSRLPSTSVRLGKWSPGC